MPTLAQQPLGLTPDLLHQEPSQGNPGHPGPTPVLLGPTPVLLGPILLLALMVPPLDHCQCLMICPCLEESCPA